MLCKNKYSIFISYRRKDVRDKAEHLKDLLEAHYKGRVSFDRDNLSGEFRVQLIERIDAVKDFILVLGKDSLAYSDEEMSKDVVDFYNGLTSLPGDEFALRMNQIEAEGKIKIDYLRIEIGRALHRKDLHIIPLVPERSADFNFAELLLPSDISPIKGYEAVFYSDSQDASFKDVVPRIMKHLKSRKFSITNGIIVAILAVLLAICMILGTLWFQERKSFAGCRTESDYQLFQKKSIFHTKACQDSLDLFLSLKANGFVPVNDSENTMDDSRIAVRWNPNCSLNQLRILRRMINNLMAVPSGDFLMGSDRVEGLENPVHRVSIESGYYISKFELTEREWASIMDDSTEENGELPMTDISWDDAQKLISRLGSLTGLVFDLPSEEQWEYAAGYGYWQKWKYAGSDDPAKVAVYDMNSGGMKKSVDSGMPNALELYNMSGNVAEWCSDGGEYKKRVRGGSFLSSADEITITYSDSASRDSGYSTIGVRLIMLY